MKPTSLGLRYLIVALFFISCATVPVERGGYCDWKDAPDWMVSDMLSTGWGVIDGVGFEEDGIQFWALLMDNPENGLGGCDYWALLMETGVDDRSGYGTPLMSVMTVGECEDWEPLKSKTK